MSFLSTLSLRRATIKISFPFRLPKKFLSTLSLRRATWGVRKAVGSLMDFYPRSPCGERQTQTQKHLISQAISIHALLAESDSASDITCAFGKDFYPRSPCGERLQKLSKAIYIIIAFLSTLSLRRATEQAEVTAVKMTISIHALLAESDIDL